MKTIAVIGLGSRGTGYMRWLKMFEKKRAKIVAVCDINQSKVDDIGNKYKIDKSKRFTDENEFFKEKLADAILICTQDRDHYRNCMQALDLDYHIMVEKPLSFNIEECEEIERVSNGKGLYVVVCHVLRYSKYFGKIKELLREGDLGAVMTINQQENIANFHFAHSFVRGNWRNKETSTPILMAKCCHDIDLITWYMDDEADDVCSYGALSHFTVENAPEGAPMRCYEGCPVGKTCPYNAVRLYIKDPFYKAKWIKYMPSVITGKYSATKKDIEKAIKQGDYGRCVYHCDNNVDDHQSVMMKFPGERIATHTLSAFTDKFYRITHITCTNGEIIGADIKGKLTVHRFDTGKTKVYRTSGLIKLPGHLEGDIRLTKAFVSLLEGTLENMDDVTFVSATIPSHRTIVRAEEFKNSCSAPPSIDS